MKNSMIIIKEEISRSTTFLHSRYVKNISSNMKESNCLVKEAAFTEATLSL